MSSKKRSWWGAFSILVSALLLIPALGQAQDKGFQSYKERKEKLYQELKIAPEKAKELQAVEEKFMKERQGAFTTLRKYQDELEKAVSAPKPDEAKVKELVTSITSEQDKLFSSFRAQRNAELALMTPLQQGKYLVALGHWRHEMMEKQEKAAGVKPGKKMEKK